MEKKCFQPTAIKQMPKQERRWILGAKGSKYAEKRGGAEQH